MARKQRYSNPHHQAEALMNQRRFSTVAALLLTALVVIVGIQYRASHAAYTGPRPLVSVIQSDCASVPTSATAPADKPCPDKYLGDGVYIQLKYDNTGQAAINKEIVITGDIPADTTYNNADQTNAHHYKAGSFTHNATTIEWRVTAIDAGEIATFPYRVNVNSNAAYGAAKLRFTSHVVWADNTVGFHAGNIINNIAVRPPAVPVISGTSSTQTSVTLNWGNVAAPPNTAVKYNVRDANNAAVKSNLLQGPATMSGTCGTSYSYQVEAVATANNGSGFTSSSRSNTATVSTQACPVEPPPQPTTCEQRGDCPPPAVDPGSGGSGSGGGTPPGDDGEGGTPPAPGVSPANNGGGTGGEGAGASADTTPPSLPGNFTATANDLSVQLTWDASTDDSGIKSYSLERSIDQVNWTGVATTIPDTNYEDTTAAFNVHYYYRLVAVDNADNVSGYAKVDVTTMSFNSNVSDTETVQITSDDGNASLAVPPGSTDADVACSLAESTSAHKDHLPSGRVGVVGPYFLLCKNVSGEEVASFKSPATLTFKIKAEDAKKYGGFVVSVFDTNKKQWVEVKGSKYDAKAGTITASVSSPGEVIVMGKVKSTVSASIIATILLIIGAFAVAFFIVLRRKQRQQYEEYIRSKYYNL